MRTFKIHAIPDWHDAPQSHVTFALVMEDDAGKHGTCVFTRGWLQRFRPMVGGFVSFSGAGLTGGTYSPIAPAKLALWGEEEGEKVPTLAPEARPTLLEAPLSTEERALVRDLRMALTKAEKDAAALKVNLDNCAKARDLAEINLATARNAANVDATLLRQAQEQNKELQSEVADLNERNAAQVVSMQHLEEQLRLANEKYDALKADRNREMREYITTRQFHQQQETRGVSIPAAEISGDAGQLPVTDEEDEAFNSWGALQVGNAEPRTLLEIRMDDLERRFADMTANVGNTLDRHQHAIHKLKRRVKALEGRA